ncbi:hypothetical protein QWU01_27670 [Kluyvera cryocrescens]|uniref:Phage tail fibre repeat n=1 Tax=Kluyvera cryocrescens TaxID=580 RepID=A0AAW9CG12_KLUCR|nr:hypothetical protein [Kluyvera cryocrescens]MDW3780572.1 hypothetical protein [Kluyvera cryocrescens]
MSAGTLTLTNNSAAVTGSGTAFNNELAAGDFIVAKAGGVTYTLPVKTIESDTALTLARNYNGPAVTAGAWTAMPRDTLNRISAQIAADTAYAIRQRVLEIDNWYQLLEVNGNVTIKMADGSSFSGPSWKKIADLLEAIDESALQAIADQVHSDAAEVAADKTTVTQAASTATQAKTDAQTAQGLAETAATAAASSNASAAQHASDAEGDAMAAAASAASAAASAGSIHPENLLQKSNNLSEITDKIAARTNLDVYSKAETDAKAGGGGSYIGQSWWHDMRSKMPDGCVAADGQQVDLVGPFADLYADVAAGNRPTTDEATWQADPTKRNCYVLNSAPGKMRLPDRNGVQPGSIKAPVMRGDGGTLTAGSVQKGGVPNIAGRIAGWTDRTGAIWSTAQLTPPFKLLPRGDGGYPQYNYGVSDTGSNGLDRQLGIDLSTSSDAYVPGLTEVRANSIVGCFVIRYAGRAQNAGSFDAMTLSARMESINSDLQAKNIATNARIDYALLSPTTQISVPQRIVLDNPFGNNTPVLVQAELLSSTGKWFNTGWAYNGSNNGSYGINASYSEGEGIVVQAGSVKLNTAALNAGGGAGPMAELTTGTYRVRVYKVTA